jgi:hypothetical protein
MAYFIPGTKIGPVPVYDTFLEKYLQALLDIVGRGRGRGGVYRTLKRHKHIRRLMRLIGRLSCLL